METVKSIPTAFANFPKNPTPFCDGIALFDKENDTFYQIVFGTGDNLSREDIENGYDDYIMYYVFTLKEGYDVEYVKQELESGEYLDTIVGLEEEDGGQMLVKRADYSNSGDIRMYIENALDMANFNFEGEEPFKNLEFVSLIF